MMKIPFNVVSVFVIFIFTQVVYSPSAAAKKRCKPFLEKLHKVQASQRSSYSLKRGESLRAKEDKARDKWWKCENTSLAKFNAMYGKKKKTKKSKSQSKKVTRQKKKYNKLTLTPMTVAKSQVSFNQHTAVVIKSKYQGAKQAAWFAFYKKPTKCQSPKNMSVFAFCHEDKRQQQDQFESVYRQ